MSSAADANASKIPVANLLRIAFYAGDHLDELEDCEASRDDGSTFEEILQAVLSRAAERIRRRGFERGYATELELTARPRGRLLLAQSIAACAIPTRRLVCQYDEFGVDTPHNRVLKACARSLARCDASKDHQDCLLALVREMHGVSNIELSRRVLRELPRSPATRRFRVVRFIAKLLVDSGQPDERIGEEWARRLNPNTNRMRRVFEKFVLRFAKAHAPAEHTVRAQQFHWSGGRQRDIPGLHTDVTVLRPGHTRIIECKYTDKILVPGRHGRTTYPPGHLFQLFGYLSRAHTHYGERSRVDGVLLYPAGGDPSEVSITLGGFPCKVVQLGLAEPWSALTARLRVIAFAG